MLKPRAKDIVILKLHSNQHELASQIEDLQLATSVRRSGEPRKHPHVGRLGLLQIVDSKLFRGGAPGVVLVAMDRNSNLPVGFYIGLKGDKKSFLTLYTGVLKNYRGLGVATRMHDEIQSIARSQKLDLKSSTISPHNIPSLKVNLNNEGFGVADWVQDRYGPGEHRFYIRGRFNYPKQTFGLSTLATLDRVELPETKPLGEAESEILEKNRAGKGFLLELVQDPGHPLETVYRNVDWKKFRGVYIHTEKRLEGDRQFLLMKPEESKWGLVWRKLGTFFGLRKETI